MAFRTSVLAPVAGVALALIAEVSPGLAQSASEAVWIGEAELQVSVPILPKTAAGAGIARSLGSVRTVGFELSATGFVAIENGTRAVCTGFGECDSRLIGQLGVLAARARLPLYETAGGRGVKAVVGVGAFGSRLDSYGSDRAASGPSGYLLEAGVEFVPAAKHRWSTDAIVSRYGTLSTALSVRVRAPIQ